MPDHLVWSEEHRAWWKPARWGYTNSIAEAGRYTKADAEAIASNANSGGKFHEIAIPVPEGLDALIERIES